MINSNAVDEQIFKTVMAASPAPVTVVTTYGDPGPVGCTVSAFMSLSLAPPLVGVALDARSSVLARIEQTGTVGINVLSAGQSDIALQLASSAADRFRDIPWWHDTDVPRLAGTTAWLRCRLADVVDVGDHRLLVCAVVGADYSHQSPMVYAERLFGSHSGLANSLQAPLVRQLAALAR